MAVENWLRDTVSFFDGGDGGLTRENYSTYYFLPNVQYLPTCYLRLS